MGSGFDFYVALRGLLEQIPEGRVSTPIEVARAMGDEAAARAVSESLRREDLRDLAGRVVESSPDPFTEFSSDRPLRLLAAEQERLAGRVVQEDGFGALELIAGADAAYEGDEAYAACVVMDRSLEELESHSVELGVDFPYVPGYLSFREAPAIIRAAEGVSGFDALLVNGHGVAHPRGCGLASHVGLELGRPTIGVARGLLVGRVVEGSQGWSPLEYGGRTVGALLELERHRVYVSVGHMVSLETSVRVVRDMTAGGVLPEPLRLAHRAAEDLKRRKGSRV